MNRKRLAVIGIGCRLPGNISSAEEYWEALLEGRDGIRPVPNDRWDNKHYYDPDKDKAGRTKNDRGGFINDIDRFDADFFGYFPAEASRMDPQQRLLLEVAHEAFEDAGLQTNALSGSRTSVYIGAFMYDYLCQQLSSDANSLSNPYVAMGTGLTSLANRISYDYNLKGPSVSLDTACSSSLVALHHACHSVWQGEADLAVAGGVNLILRPESTIMLSRAGFLNTDGYCKAFDASANGYVRAEGAGIVILKALDKAMDDGDRIYAVVCGSAVNQDGYVAEGFTVPSAASQIEVLKSAYASAGIDPATVHYIEAHGTGTAVGDPIECKALGTVIGQAREGNRHCLLGSVKSNLGHLEGGAGIAGFIKGVLVAYNRKVPPSLHFKTPNPNIDFDGLKLRVADRVIALESNDSVRVGINSFGAGGTNAHVVVESCASANDGNENVIQAFDAPRPFIFSARSREALDQLAARYLAMLQEKTVNLADLGASLIERRSRYPVTLTVSAASQEELIDALRAFTLGDSDKRNTITTVEQKTPRKMAFMFSGQGGQWAQMGMRLYAKEQPFRKSMDEIDALFVAQSGWSILEEIKKEAKSSDINNTTVVQPAIFAIQVSLARLLMGRGFVPEGIVGHSIGEVAGAHIAEAITLEQAVRVIYQRSQIQNKASGKGKMLAVALTPDQAADMIKGVEHRVSIATVNGPSLLTIAGDTPVLENLADKLAAQGVFNRFVRVQVPYHSHHMEPLLEEMLSKLDGENGRTAELPLYSTVTAKQESGAHLDAHYWYANVRKPVQFMQTIETMLDDGYDCFVEVGPHPVLVGGVDEIFKYRNATAFATTLMHRKKGELAAFNHSIGSLVAVGIRPVTKRLFPEAQGYIELPKYP